MYQNGKNIPNIHKTWQTAVKYTKWTKNIPAPSIVRPSNVYPNLDFWLENVPSGNPVANARQTLCLARTVLLRYNLLSLDLYFLKRCRVTC
jgi:hypothetical protein